MYCAGREREGERERERKRERERERERESVVSPPLTASSSKCLSAKRIEAILRAKGNL